MNAPAEKPAADAAPAAKPLDQALRAFLESRPIPGALAVLAAYAVLPAAGLLVSTREGPSLWTWASAILLAGTLLPAVAVALRRTWAHIPAAWLGWTGAVGAAVRGLSTGEIPVHLPAVAFGAFLVAAAGAMRPPPPPASAPPERRPESVDQWVRENLEAIVIAFIMALVIRCFCIEVFKIPSSSMEPTLLGDNKPGHVGCTYATYHVDRHPGGDRIMVTKFFYAFSDIERYDVLVFKFPLNQPRNFIKRVVGLPDEQLRIYKGNLFVQKPLEKRFAIARRTLRTQDSVWIDPVRGHDFFEDIVFFRKYWEPLALPGAERAAADLVQDRELRTEENQGNRGIRFKYINPPTDGHGQDVGELRLAFEFELTSPQGQVFAEISNEFGRFELVLSTDAASRLDWTKPKAARETERRPLEGFRLEMDRRHRLDLCVYDGRAVARIDGKEWSIDYLNFREDPRPTPEGEIGLAFGSKDATFRVRKLSVGRDIYYKGKDGIREDVAVKIKPGHYVMMGDNVDSSHDSRSWKLKRYLLEDGRTVECEGQEVKTSSSGNQDEEVKPEEVMRRYGMETPPELFIAGDRNGTPWLLYRAPPAEPIPPGRPVGIFKTDPEEEYFSQIPEQNIVGKGLWIWWPPGRWFNLIR